VHIHCGRKNYTRVLYATDLSLCCSNTVFGCRASSIREQFMTSHVTMQHIGRPFKSCRGCTSAVSHYIDTSQQADLAAEAGRGKSVPFHPFPFSLPGRPFLYRDCNLGIPPNFANPEIQGFLIPRLSGLKNFLLMFIIMPRPMGH